jgi:hypothetical protein
MLQPYAASVYRLVVAEARDNVDAFIIAYPNAEFAGYLTGSALAAGALLLLSYRRCAAPSLETVR